MSKRVDMQDTPFSGVSRSYTTLSGTAGWPECRSCGSSLAGRLERVLNATATRDHAVEVFRCRCGRGRHVRRPV
jgi:hypothetical protein